MNQVIALDEYLMITEGYIFLFLIENIYCDPSSELSHRDGSDEALQHVFYCRINKSYPELSPDTPSYLELCTLYFIFLVV